MPLVASVVPLVTAWRVDRPFDYLVPSELADVVVPGCVARVIFGRRRVRAVVRSVEAREPDRELQPIAGVVVADPVAGPPLDGLFDWEARRYVTTAAASWGRAVPARVKVQPAATPHLVKTGQAPDAVLALEGGRALLSSLGRREAGVFVVRPEPHTHRGALVAAMIDSAAPGSALVAVPEVRYGSTMLDELAGRFNALVRADSMQSEEDRSAALLRLARGRGLGAGGRAIVHAPAPDLRLLVVDEEHHHSYKEDRSPRYDARRVAAKRAELQGCACVLISATPSVESSYRAATGGWGSAGPSRRAEKDFRPLVEVVPPDPNRALGQALFDRMRSTLQRGGRVAILVPAPGYARALWCAACRRSLRCPMCESGLATRGRPVAGGEIRCPSCGYDGEVPAACPSCGSSNWRFIGAGSERHAEQLTKAFPRARVWRVDPDALEAPSEPPDIYVTTWIGTKPAIRPEVSLVGVLDADALIRRPEFRAAENAYHALAAMAEWAGPAGTGGRLVLQSSEPGHHSVQAVVRADYSYFLERELEFREELGYPPFAELVRVRAAPEQADSLTAAIDAARGVGGRVLGPALARRGGRDAQEILIKCSDAEVVADKLRDVVVASAGALSVDVDPR